METGVADVAIEQRHGIIPDGHPKDREGEGRPKALFERKQMADKVQVNLPVGHYELTDKLALRILRQPPRPFDRFRIIFRHGGNRVTGGAPRMQMRISCCAAHTSARGQPCCRRDRNQQWPMTPHRGECFPFGTGCLVHVDRSCHRAYPRARAPAASRRSLRAFGDQFSRPGERSSSSVSRRPAPAAAAERTPDCDPSSNTGTHSVETARPDTPPAPATLPA